MAKAGYLKGSTSVTTDIFINDSSLTDGGGKTGLAFNTASLTAYYVRERSASVAITLATQTVTGAYSSGGFVEIDATNMPGVYRLDIPDAALATGSNSVVVMLKGAANMAPLVLEIELEDINRRDGVRMGMSALPNTACATNASLITSGTGTAQLSVASGVATANATQFAGQTITAAAGVTIPSTIASPTNITAGTITTVTNLTNAPTAGDFTATMKTSLNAATPASVVGSVGSVVAGVTVTTNSDKTGYQLSSTGVNDILRTALTEGYAADGAAFTLEQALFMLWSLMAEKSVAGTTLTAKKLDGSTSAMTFTLDSATAPTSITRAT